MEIKLLRRARKEFFDAVEYYYDKSPAAADNFIEEIKKTFDSLSKFPLAGRKISDSLRKIVLPNFPYYLLYRLKKNMIEVTVVAHQSRHPDYWKGRKN